VEDVFLSVELTMNSSRNVLTFMKEYSLCFITGKVAYGSN